MTIVRTAYRYKRPPGERKAAAIEGPTIFSGKNQGPSERGALLAAVVAAGLMVTLAASAQQAGTVVMFYSGNDLLQKCTSADVSGQNICIGFVAGVADALDSVSRKGGELAGWRACRPPDLSMGQVNDVVVQFLQAHPEIRQLTAASLVARALGTAWPHSCP